MNTKVVGVLVAIVIIVAAIPIVSKLASGGSSAPAAAKAGSSSATAVAGDVVTALTRGDMAAVTSHFDATMKAGLPESKLAETWNTVIAQAGAFKKQLGTRTDKVQGQDVVIITCELERAKLDVQVAVSPSGQVSGLYFRPAS